MNRGKQLQSICEKDDAKAAECWISFESDGNDVRRVTVWDSEPHSHAARAVALVFSDGVVSITTDEKVVAAFLS